MALEGLPFEVLEIIFNYLGVLDRLAASSVCKRWYYASLNINVWKDAAVCFNTERVTEGLNVLMNCERPFSCVVFRDFSEAFPNRDTVFLHAVEMCKIVGWHLNILQFKNCSVSGPHFVQILGECPNLKSLSAIDCENLFSSEDWLTEPEEIARLKLVLKNVKEVDISCNRKLSDKCFTQLGQIFTNVESLSLAKCKINFKSVIIKRFYPRRRIKPWDHILTFYWIKEFITNNATRIISVNFSDTSIDDASLKELATIEGLQLESISLSCCQELTTKAIKEFCKCQKKLKKLDVPVSLSLDKILPDVCANLQELREFSVGCFWPPEKVPSLLALETHTLSRLAKLKLDHCCEIIVLKFIDSLRNEAYPKLRHLSLHQDKVDDYIFIYTIPYLLHITYLDLGCTLITDKSLIMISTHLVLLQVLQLSQCESITDKGLTGHSEACPLFLNQHWQSDVLMEDGVGFGNRRFLKWLVFDEDHPVSVSNLKGLRELNLYGISGITDDGIKEALMFKELRILDIGGCPEVTEEGLLAVGQNNRTIEVLSLRSSANITENGIAKILDYLPRLKFLDLQDCKKLTNRRTLSRLLKERSLKFKFLL